MGSDITQYCTCWYLLCLQQPAVNVSCASCEKVNLFTVTWKLNKPTKWILIFHTRTNPAKEHNIVNFLKVYFIQ
jgi:hypothetical protein